MNRLPSVIGPAPSELPFDQLIEKLQKERQRITTSIALWKQRGSWKKTPKKGKGKKKKTVSMASIRALKAAGISPEEFRELLEEEKRNE